MLRSRLRRHLPLLCFALSFACFLLFGGLLVRRAFGGGQPAPAAANAAGAAPLQQAVPQADGLIGEVL